MNNFNRYGVVHTRSDGRVYSFSEKCEQASGNINGGVYLFNSGLWDQFQFSHQFSIEEDVFQKKVHQLKIYSYLSTGYFIDIGVSDDYHKAQLELPTHFN